jgi:HNH endonuclease
MRSITPQGYVLIDGLAEHTRLAEKAVGKKLPITAQVHHFNKNRQDNSPGNLVVCQDSAYHALIHMRQKAYAACGNKTFRKCSYCKLWDNPENMKCRFSKKQGDEYRHRSCHSEYERFRKKAKSITF